MTSLKNYTGESEIPVMTEEEDPIIQLGYRNLWSQRMYSEVG